MPNKYLVRQEENRTIFQWEKVKPFAIYCVAFVGSLYCNITSSFELNAETAIAFKAMTPIAVSVLEYLYLGRDLPSLKSFTGLTIIVIGAISYVRNDLQFASNGFSAYTWVGTYFCLICFLMWFSANPYERCRFDAVGNVYYTNLISLPLIIMFAMGTGESSHLSDMNFTTSSVLLLLLSCITGTGIAYSGWWCRSAVSSATTFTLIGVVNKLLTILVNILMAWDNHANLMGIVSLGMCLVGAALYKPSKMRKKKTQQSDDVVKKRLLEMGSSDSSSV